MSAQPCASKRGRSEGAPVIDLCSPVPVKPCRISTPLWKTTPGHDAPPSDGDDNKDAVSVALFDVDHERDSTLVDDGDEYWEPAEYKATLVTASLGSQSSSNLHQPFSSILNSAIQAIDENAPPANGDDDIIDLCSSQGSTHAVPCSSSSLLLSTSIAAPRVIEVDLTQDCDDSPVYCDSGAISDLAGSQRNLLQEDRFSFFQRVTAAPTLQSIYEQRSTSPPPMVSDPTETSFTAQPARKRTPKKSKPLTALCLSQGPVTVTTDAPDDTPLLTVTEQFSSAAASKPRGKKAGAAAGTKGGSRSSCAKADSTSTADGLVVSSTVNFTVAAPADENPLPPISSAVAAPSAPSAFRSRFTEKTLTTLPALPTGAGWEVLLLIDQRETKNARIQSKMAASCIPCRLSTLAVGDFLWVVRPRGGMPSSSSFGSSSSGAVGAVRSGSAVPASQPPAASQQCWAVTGEDEDDEALALAQQMREYGQEEGDTRASAVDDEDEDRTFDTSNVYVLDCVAERKSINDLVSSLYDGRYLEQKNRLTACNLRSTIYIVEGDPTNVSTAYQKAITPTHLKNAMVSLNVSPCKITRCCVPPWVSHQLCEYRWTAECTCSERAAWTIPSPAFRTFTSENFDNLLY
jgi:hypothetical protein